MQAGHRTALRFGGLFVGLIALYYVVALTPVFDRLLYWYLCGNARLAGGMLRLFGHNIQVVETSVRSPAFAINIQRGCDAIEPAWLFCAAVLATPIVFIKKIPVLPAGVGLILTVNLVRIVSLFLVGLRWPGLFQAAHLEIWPVLFIFLALGLWGAWISWIKREEQRHASA